MKIIVDNFTIIPQDYQYDLVEHKTVNKKDGGESSKEETIAYGISMERCIKKIVHLRLKSREETVSLGRFLTLYKNEMNKVNRLVEIGAEG